MNANQFDAVIVGGGHNGLVAAAYLARAGRKVLVLERRELLGGCCVTEEIWPGFRVSTAAYLASLLQERIVRELELERFGYVVDAKDPAFFSMFPDGRHFFMWQDDRKTLDEIAKFSKRDAETYPVFEQHLEKLAAVVESLLLTAPPDFPPRRVGDFVDYLKVAARMRKLSRREMVGLVKVFTQSAADFLDEWFESPQVKVTLATDGVIGANGGPRSPGTAYILLHHCMGGVGGKRGLWGFVRGGMGAISEAIAQSARSKGAEIRVNAPVQRILVNDGRVRGVVLENGEEIEAPLVASNLDPHVTFLRLLQETDLDPEFRESIRKFRIEGTSLKINLALSGLPDFRAMPGAGPQHRATMHICPSIDYVERAWDDAKFGRPSERPMLEMTIPTMYDPSLAPPGRHIMGIFLQYAPYTLRECQMGRRARAVRRSRPHSYRGICARLSRAGGSAPGAHTAGSRAALWTHRRQYLPRRNEPRSDVRHAARRRLGAIPHPHSRSLSVRVRCASRRRSHGRPGIQCSARHSP